MVLTAVMRGKFQRSCMERREDYWSLRVNDQWRIIFRWEGNDAHDVQIVDYHR